MTPYAFDIVCIGNAKIDTFLTLDEANHNLRFLKETNELCVKFGEKITVDKAEVLLGGNAANVAVGASRLGLKTALVAEIGVDEFAQKIINTLSVENVDTSSVMQTQGQQSSFSTIINFKKERTIFSEHVRREHNFNFENIATKWVYLTSLGDLWQDAYNKTVNFVNNKCHLAFNPGTLQIEQGLSNIEHVMTATHVLFVNKQEAMKISNENKSSTFFSRSIDSRGKLRGFKKVLDKNENPKLIKQLLVSLKNLGPKIIVITDGENGSFAIDEKGVIYRKGVVKAEVVEKTGAGDAYASGFISAFIKNKSIDEAMEWGTKNSASVINKVGAQAGLLRKID